MWHLINKRKIPQNLLVIFLALVLICGDSNCSPSSSCPFETKNEGKEQPQLKLWKGHEFLPTDNSQPRDKEIYLTAPSTISDSYTGVKISDVHISCAAPYPVLLVSLMANDSEDEFLMSSMSTPIFNESFVTLNSSLIANQTVFKTQSSLTLSMERNVIVFACEAVHNSCLGSAGKLVFTYHGKYNDSSGKQKYNFTVTMAQNLQPYQHPFLTSSHRSLPLTNATSLRTSNNNSNTAGTGAGTGYSREQQADCDAIFYYQFVKSRFLFRGSKFELAYACEFLDGTPGFVKVHQCRNRARCNFRRQQNQSIRKNCWRPYSPGENCENCTQMTAAFIRLMDPFVPFCISKETTPPPLWGSLSEDSKYYMKKQDMADGIRVVKGTPLYIGFPSGFNISRPHIRTWDNGDEDDGGNERMIRMLIFEEVQLVNSTIKVTCESVSHYTSKAFKYALKFWNETELEFLNVTNDPVLVDGFFGDIYSQTMQLRLHETDLNMERIFCFAPVQNSLHWINASRPLRVVPHVQDLFKPSHGDCENSNSSSNPRTKSHPFLFIKKGNFNSLYVSEKNDTKRPFNDKRERIVCQAYFPIQLIYNSQSVYKTLTQGSIGKYEAQFMFVKEGQTNVSVLYEFSTNVFNLGAKNKSQNNFFRCQSIENPCLYQSFQFSRAQLRINRSNRIFQNFPPAKTSQTLQTELGRPPNYSECQFLVLYMEIPYFPGYEFRCQFPLEQYGKINFHYCDTVNECANTFRNRRQSSKCWRKVKEWGDCNKDCGIQKPTGFRPFVATCSYDQKMFKSDGYEPHHREFTLGSFAVFGISTKPQERTPIYFSEEEIDPRNMTFLEPFDPYQLPGTKLNLTCTVSAFFNTDKYVQAVKYFANKNKYEIVEYPPSFSRAYQFPKNGPNTANFNEDWHTWLLTWTIYPGNDPDLSHIYCIGLYWKGSNSSREIYLHAPELPQISLQVKDSKGKRIIVQKGKKLSVDLEPEELFSVSSENVSLACHAHRYPPPEIAWATNAVNEPKIESNVVNATHSLSRITLSVVDVGVKGTYICTAKNQEGKVTSSLKVGIQYPVNKFVVVISSVASFVVLVLIFALFLFVRRVRKLKQTLRDLSDEEVNQFHFGDRTVDPSDSNAEIYALEYNRSLEVSPGSIEIDENSLALGAGEFGIVRPGFLKSSSNSDSKDSENESGIPVAIKMPKFNVTTENFKSFLYEIKIMSFVQSHENVLKILAASTITIKKRRALIALEFCELGDLKNFLINFLKDETHAFRNEFQTDVSGADSGYATPWATLAESQKLETLDLRNFSFGIANGMNFLAEKKVIHGDLAARNVLLTWNREVKISDFGFSTQLKNYETYAKTNSIKIPWRWFPLEALVPTPRFTLKSDCWSFGIVLYEIFSLGEDPYPDFDRLEPKFIQSLRGGYRPEKPEFANKDMYDLMTECWQQDPNERPTFSQVCEKILDLSREIVVSKLNLI